MSYPDLPNNRLIVNGVDLTDKYGMILIDGYTLEPPAPKTYTVDIPGGNGQIDLTEALSGDTVYENRNQEFTFYLIHPENFERAKTDISNFLHGKAFDYTMTMDPDYTYHGRFTVSSYEHKAYNSGIVGVIVIKIDAQPYKRRVDQVVRIDGVGGKIVNCVSGRMRTRPSIETSGFVRVIFDGQQFELPAGTWNINDILFSHGSNEIYFCTYDIRNLRWTDLKTNNVTWGSFKNKKLFEWYKSNGDGTYVINTWEDMSSRTWSSVANSKWSDLQHSSTIDTSNVKDVYISYEWGDL